MPELDPIQRQRLQQALFERADRAVVAVLDGAVNPTLIDRLSADDGPRFECLMGDYLEPDLAEVAPYAVELVQGTPFCDWLLANMWGEHWGIVARCSDGFRAAARRFRSLFIVFDPDDQPLYFRFYDPRALRIVAPTCSAEQLAEIFGGDAEIWIEGRAPGAVSVLSVRDAKLAIKDTDFKVKE